MLLKTRSASSDGILVVELEPTPYKTDLWNSLEDVQKGKLLVIYTENKNPAPDGGHKYKKWPLRKYNNIIFSGSGFLGLFNSTKEVVSNILWKKFDLVYIAGYDRFVCMLAILASLLCGSRFVVHADVFNIGMPLGRFRLLKLIVRELIRKVVFWRSRAVLVCGDIGLETAKKAGCKSEKIIDFPYVIDVSRMRDEIPENQSSDCQSDIDADRLIIMFSGRMIPRKGLETLLLALPRLKTIKRDWVLWIEGDGPEFLRFQSLSRELNVSDKCRFLGFCQYDTHGWLMSSSDIIVVPSTEDTWGIIVDEGLQLGKLVISSDAVGSGLDRVQSGVNGYLFPAGNVSDLGDLLEKVIGDDNLRLLISEQAVSRSKIILPRDNARALTSLLYARQ
jgi:glycosyltransferase involved in cell wall biosynthesis